MTPKAPQDLRDWSAQAIMGWVLRDHEAVGPAWYDGDRFQMRQKDWRPDAPESPAKQILMFVKRMRELGWAYEIKSWEDGHRCIFGKGRWRDKERGFAIDPNPCLAILLAAKATEVKDGH